MQKIWPQFFPANSFTMTCANARSPSPLNSPFPILIAKWNGKVHPAANEFTMRWCLSVHKVLSVSPQITTIGIRTAGHACAFQGFSLSVTKDSLFTGWFKLTRTVCQSENFVFIFYFSQAEEQLKKKLQSSSRVHNVRLSSTNDLCQNLATLLNWLSLI